MAIIDKPTDHFNTVLYTGNGTSQSITGIEFAPKFTWIKDRTSAGTAHILFDIIRGATYRLNSNTTNSEFSIVQSLTAFNSDGFSVGSYSEANTSGNSFVSWNWRGSDSSAVSNTSGSITSTVSANTTSGFSIVSYTGTGATATVGHGLSQTPEMIIVKLRSGSGTDWITWGSILGGTVGSEFIKLNTTGAKTTGLNSSWFNNTAPTSTVFTVGTQSDLNGSGGTYIAYCFAEVKGFSKFGSYTGNGSTDGTFVYTGFKPAFVLLKQSTSTTQWFMLDNKRNTYNVVNDRLRTDTSDSGSTSLDFMDFTSNGFKMRGTYNGYNVSGGTYIYMAFAENPFVTSTANGSIPATAR
jgi:hypothetical protein